MAENATIATQTDAAGTAGSIRVRRRPRQQNRPQLQPPHAVILHDDPINRFEYVIGVLRKVFHYNGVRCFWLTLVAHCTGKAIVWTGTLEVAELKADQIRSCGPDPKKIKTGAQALTVTTEPLPA
jgi:ATP-dependent Clp protease adaptor protein ClpS